MTACDALFCAHLDDRQAKRLLEGDVCEDAARREREAVDVGDVALRMLLGVGHAAVQVVHVDELHDLHEDLLAAPRHAVDVVAVALHLQMRGEEAAGDEVRSVNQGCPALHRCVVRSCVQDEVTSIDH